jgi:hypothetical protein
VYRRRWKDGEGIALKGNGTYSFFMSELLDDAVLW